MKRYLRAFCLSVGMAVVISIAVLAQPSLGVVAQVQVPASPTPVPKPTSSPAPIVSPAASPVATAPAPRAGGFPMELAMPLLAGGTAAAAAGAYLLRRGRR